MKIMLIGSGGREAALAFKINKSPLKEQLFIVPGSDYMSRYGKCYADIAATDIIKIKNLCEELKPDLVIVGPEAPLELGLTDVLETIGITVFAPSKKAALLETSKLFTKQICKEYNIPSASYKSFNDYDTAIKFIRKKNEFPVVIKLNTPAAGKGVLIADNLNHAATFIEYAFHKRGEKEIIIEEYLTGQEISAFVAVYKNQPHFLTTACDYKKIYDGNKGNNTGGMGSYSPACHSVSAQEIMKTFILPTLEALSNRNISYTGILYAGLMLTNKGPYLLEYNARLGDPETQAIIMRLESDLLRIIDDLCHNKQPEIKFSDKSSVCVVLAAKGYPADYVKNDPIHNIHVSPDLDDDVQIFHAGTVLKKGVWHSNGGRVLNIATLDQSLSQARRKAYDIANNIMWHNKYYRKDIAK